MKKSLTLMGLAVILGSAALVSCGQSTGSATGTAGSASTTETAGSASTSGSTSAINVDWSKFKNASNQTKVTFWINFKADKTSPIGTILTSIIDAFQQTYPGIKIDTISKGGYSQLYDAVKSSLAAGTTPTMALAYPDHIAAYLNASMAVEDMTPYMNDPVEGFGHDDDLKGVKLGDSAIDLHTAQDDVIPAYLAEGNNYILNNQKLKGYYSLPWAKSSEILFYDKTMFDQYGWDASKLATWEGIWELNAQILKDAPEIAAAAQEHAGGAFAYDSDDNMFITLSKQLGIDYTDGTQPNPFTFASTGKTAGEAMVKNLASKYSQNLFITQKTNSGNGAYNDDYMLNGRKLAIDVSSTAGARFLAPGANKVGDTVYAAAPYPKSSTDWVNGGSLNASAQGDAVISQGPGVTFFRRASQDEKAAAWLFYKFATSDYMSSAYAAATGYEPVRTSSYNLAPMTGLSDYMKSVHNIVKGYSDENRLYVSDVFVGSAEARTAVGGIFGGVVNTKDYMSSLDATVEAQYQTALADAAKGLPAA